MQLFQQSYMKCNHEKRLSQPSNMSENLMELKLMNQVMLIIHSYKTY